MHDYLPLRQVERVGLGVFGQNVPLERSILAFHFMPESGKGGEMVVGTRLIDAWIKDLTPRSANSATRQTGTLPLLAYRGHKLKKSI